MSDPKKRDAQDYLAEKFEEDLRTTNFLLDEAKHKLTELEANWEVRKRKKYRFMLSHETMGILLVTGIFFIIMSLLYSRDAIRYGNRRAAIIAVGSALLYEFLCLLWSVRSIKLQKEFKQDVADKVSSGEINPFGFAYTVKKSTNIRLKYNIEKFEKLSKGELEAADKEWDSFLCTATDTFLRLPSIIFTFSKDGRIYKIYIELRYSEAYPDGNKVEEIEEKVTDEIDTLLDFDLSKGQYMFKEKVKEIVRTNFSLIFPEIKLNEVCVAIVIEFSE